MDFPGLCKLTLTSDAMERAIESSLNKDTRCVGQYIRVTDVRREYTYGDWTVEITTDEIVVPAPAELRVA